MSESIVTKAPEGAAPAPDAGTTAAECRRDMVAAARAAMIEKAPADVAEVLRAVPEFTLTTRIAGEGEKGPRTRFAHRTDSGTPLVEVALDPDSSALTDAQLAALAVAVGLCGFAQPRVPGMNDAQRAGIRRGLCTALAGGAMAVPALDVAKLSKVALGTQTSAIAVAITAAAAAQQGRAFGRAMALGQKRTGGSLAVLESKRRVDVKPPEEARGAMLLCLGSQFTLRGELEGGPSWVVASGKLLFRWNEPAKGVSESYADYTAKSAKGWTPPLAEATPGPEAPTDGADGEGAEGEGTPDA